MSSDAPAAKTKEAFHPKAPPVLHVFFVRHREHQQYQEQKPHDAQKTLLTT
jgi:hypothetical protein